LCFEKAEEKANAPTQGAEPLRLRHFISFLSLAQERRFYTSIMIDWRIGTMGFSYADWVGAFYPSGTKPGEFLEHYARHFNAVELDTTFHAIPPAGRVRHWAGVTPTNFRFSVKTPRTVTHELPLSRAGDEMRRFLDVARELGEKLAVVLLQFPPSFSIATEAALRTFLDELPRDVRYAVEFRHPSWDTPKTAAMCSAHHICLVAADYVHEPLPIRLTSDFLYLRFVGEHHRFKQQDREQIDPTQRLNWWIQQIDMHRSQVGSIWAMFNNDFAGYSVATARRIRELLKLPAPTPETPLFGTLFG
jgi:uncharacterized protein YecE (DUF72 family)